MVDILLTFLLNDMLEEPLLIISLSNDINQDIILLPHTIDLVVLVFDDGPLAMPCDTLIDVLLLRDVNFISVSERSSEIIKHFLFWGVSAQSIWIYLDILN